MNEKLYKDVQNWMYRNARNIELRLFQYLFEDGDKESVLSALEKYQNEDGGFGHALEADSWNPNSSPITTQHALLILEQIDFWDMQHPIYQGIWKYLNSEQDLLEYGWRFTIPTNDGYPHAPWWNYNEECNQKEYFGVTAGFTAFILSFGEKGTRLYEKALAFADKFFEMLLLDMEYGNSGLEGYITLIKAVDKLKLEQYDITNLTTILAGKIQRSIKKDEENWAFYGVRPSDYIMSPDSPFYKENSEIVKKELQFLLDTKPENDVWGITWTWFDNMEQYEREFTISENWWKGYKAIQSLVFLRNFERYI